MKKILILYSELAQYTVAAINALQQEHDTVIHIVRWEVNREAPFNFIFDEDIKVHLRDHYTTQELLKFAQELDPDIIYCSGWMDKGYLKVCSAFKKNVPVVVGLDNHWTGSLKQHLVRAAAPFTLHKWFTHAWVAGDPQKRYAQKVGFRDENILEGVYTADVNLFQKQYHSNKEGKKKNFPHRFLYVGRYIEHKGVMDLIDAFSQFKEMKKSDWELWCCGTGPLEDELPETDGVRHFGFVQPDALAEIAAEAGVFVLPSHFEPWGVVVHEFAAAGFPLICTDKVGAVSSFLEEKKNGFIYPAGNKESLQKLFKKMSELSDEQLNEMSEHSFALSKKITPSTWSRTMLSVLNSNHN